MTDRENTDETAEGSHRVRAGDIFVQVHAELRAELDTLAFGAPMPEGTPFPEPDAFSQIQRRTLIRSMFSLVEAMNFGLRMMALDTDDIKDRLPPAEIALAREEDYELDDSGKVKVRKAKLRFLPGTRFSFRISALAEGAAFALDVQSEGWNRLRASAKVRDRLMHPKGLEDISISDDEIRDALAAFAWYEDQVYDVLEAANKAGQQAIDALQEQADAAARRIRDLETLREIVDRSEDPIAAE